MFNTLLFNLIIHKPLGKFQPWIEWFTSEIEQMPIRNVPDHKRSFLPSKSEKLKVGRLVHALKMGWMKTKKQLVNINKV